MNPKQFLTVAAFMLSNFAIYSQQWNGSATASNLIYRSGNVTIGDTYNLAKFNIKGVTNYTHFMHGTNEDIYLRPGTNNGNILMDKGKVAIGTLNPLSFFHVYNALRPDFLLSNPLGGIIFSVAYNYGDGAPNSRQGDGLIILKNQQQNVSYHGLIFNMNDNNNDGNSYIKFVDWANEEIMGIYNNSIVRIDGKLISKEIDVKLNVWSDFVFDPQYNLITLNDLEKYINEHHHLPGVPTEAEVLEKGVNVGEMNATLLQKIEELTLYLIDQDKKINQQDQKIEELETKINQLFNNQ